MKLKQFSAALLFTALSTAVLPTANAAFTDVPSDVWFTDAVSFCENTGSMVGSNGQFRPYAYITRAECASLLSRLAKVDTKQFHQEFQDVPSAEWYAPAIFQYGGTMSGNQQQSGHNLFYPDRNATREEFAQGLFQMMVVAGWQADGWAYPFADLDSVPPECRQAVCAMGQQGIMVGQNGVFMPKQPITRAEMAVIIYNLTNGSAAHSQNDASSLTQAQLQQIRQELNVPNDLDVTFEIGKRSYWDAAARWMVDVGIIHNGERVAGAFVDPSTGELLRNILNYQN